MKTRTMNKEIKIVAGVGLAAGTVVGAYILNNLNRRIDCDDDIDKKMKRRCLNNSEGMSSERRLKNMFNKKEANAEVREEIGTETMGKTVLGTVTPDDIASHKICRPLSPIEKEKIKDVVKGMSEEEMKITLQNIPMELIFNHIAGVLERNRQFAQSIQDAMSKLQE